MRGNRSEGVLRGNKTADHIPQRRQDSTQLNRAEGMVQSERREPEDVRGAGRDGCGAEGRDHERRRRFGSGGVRNPRDSRQ